MYYIVISFTISSLPKGERKIGRRDIRNTSIFVAVSTDDRTPKRAKPSANTALKSQIWNTFSNICLSCYSPNIIHNEVWT